MSKIDFSKMGPDGPINETAAINKQWWKAPKADLAKSVTAIIDSISKSDSARQSQYQLSGKMFGNVALTGVNGLSFNKVTPQTGMKDRVTYNVISSTIETVSSKMAQSKPKPLFLTTGGDYKIQRRAKKLDKFCDGIFYENSAYKLGPEIFRDACIFGDGIIHVFEDRGRVRWERVLASELFVDLVDAFYGSPRQMHRVKTMDRGVLLDLFPNKKNDILLANSASGVLTGSSANVADLVSVSESWHLPSGPGAKDGIHCICLSDVTLFSEPYEKDFFPFVILNWSKRIYGIWGQGLAEQLQSIQLEINKILFVIQRSMHLYGTFKIWMKTGSKLPKEHLNNEIGAIMISDEMPRYISNSFIPQEYFSHLQTLKNSAFEQAGVSQLSATSKKPSGLDSGRALREFNDIETERFTVVGQCYEQMFLDLAKLSISVAKDIYKENKKYKVKVPGKKFIETIDWKEIDLDEDQFTMKIYPISKMSDDPSDRLQTITEYMQAGMITVRAGRRLMNDPDLEAADSLADAQEDYLHSVLEKIIDEGEYTAPEPMDDLSLATELAVEYYAVGKNNGLEEEKLELLRNFMDQVGILQQKAASTAQSAQAQTNLAPQANPEPAPTSDMVPNSPNPSTPAAA